MPKEYEDIKDSLEKQGYDSKKAKGFAARIFNKRHGKGHGLRPDKKGKDKGRDVHSMNKTEKKEHGDEYSE